jgi:hypothetical protein
MKPHHLSGVTEMRAKALTLAIVAAIIALPVPASQLLAGTSSAPSIHASPAAEPSTKNLGLLLQDPFLIDTLSYLAPASFLEPGELP